VNEQLTQQSQARLTGVLQRLDISNSSWYHTPIPKDKRKRRGPKGKPISAWIERVVVDMATTNPWYGYKRIAVMCRRAGYGVKNRQCYRVMKQHDLLQKRRPREAEIYQAAKLWELLPQAPNDLWQMDVTYIHIPGHGWWYAVTVIDYYSRYLLACYLTPSYSAAAVTTALAGAKREAERIHGRLAKLPFIVTDNGSSFIAKRFGQFVKNQFVHVRIAYRTPTQLGLLERFHRTLKQEEVYWQLYDNPAHARDCLAVFHKRYNTQRPHWALIPAEGGDPLTPEDVYVKGLTTQIPKWQTWAIKAKEKLDQMMNQDTENTTKAP